MKNEKLKDYTATTADCEDKKPEKEYTPIRKFYAWFGFISILFCIGILVYSLIHSINYINHNIDEYEPPRPLLLEIEELKALIMEQDTLIRKQEKFIAKQDAFRIEQNVLIINQDSVITDQLSLLERQDVLIKKQGLLIKEWTDGL